MLTVEQINADNESEYNKMKALDYLEEFSDAYSSIHQHLDNISKSFNKIQESLNNICIKTDESLEENIKNETGCKYTALEISRYIINKCIELNRPISNLQLQKILYYVQGEYINKTNGMMLFGENIIAWAYGPAIPRVYYKYNIYASSYITTYQEKIDLSEDISNIIDPVINEKSKLSTWNLVESTHSESPWLNTYKQGEDNIITIIELKKWFIKNI